MKKLAKSSSILIVGLILCLNYSIWNKTGDNYSSSECERTQLNQRSYINSDSINVKGDERQKFVYNNFAGSHFESLNASDSLILGTDPRNNERRRFMTIGIPSAWREQNYLMKTVDSILKGTNSYEKEDIFIYILLADADPHLRSQRAAKLKKKYRKEIQTGLLKVLQPPVDLYPDIDYDKIRRTYNDPVERVKWRLKQALDFAFLFWYVGALRPSAYYLVLEDDILSAKNFVNAAREFIDLHKNHHWIALQLAGFLSIGQLLRCEDLNRLSSFLLLFHREQPADILMNTWIALMAPEDSPHDRPTQRVPALFQHIGVKSTLANKTQNVRDETFGLSEKRFPDHVNPEAEILTTIKRYRGYRKELPYSPAPGIFWGIPDPGDTYDIIFARPLRVSRVVVITGSVKGEKVKDQLTFGKLEVSSKFLLKESPRRASCEGFTPLQRFKKGEVDVRHLRQLFPEGLQCLRISVGSLQKSWIIVKEIAVFADEDEDDDDDR